jgi:hypothetical protein
MPRIDPTLDSEAPAITDPVSTVATYLDAFYVGDFKRAASVLAEDFDFEGPFLKVTGREAYLAGAEGLRQIVGGHRLVRQWVDGDEVSTLYEVALRTPVGEGSVLMSEWHRVRAGRIGSGRVVFDTADFRSLVPAKL